jgi:hypothetical protein
MEVMYAENPIDPKTGRLSKRTNYPVIEHYDTRDSEEQALRYYFSSAVPSDSTEIAADEYHRLYSEYSRATNASPET